ncbi:MAG TPA: hypothetical protein VHV30_04990 [Polyangiaceae bacterium]|nr:hypothetical protein [Polyangiaceae bacterium]
MLFGAAVACGVGSTARADDPGNASDAKVLFEKARDLRAKGDCAGALPLFQKAYTLYPLGLGSLRNVAVCQEALNHFASSRDAWLELKRAVTGSTDSKYAGWSDDAEKAVAKLTPKIAHLTIDLTVATPAGDNLPSDSADVLVDGQPLPKDHVNIALDHDPGSFVVTAAGANVVPPEPQTVVLAPGESRVVMMHVTVRAPAEPVATAAPLPAQPAPEEAAPPPSRSNGLRTGAWIAIGVGAAGLAGAAVSYVLRQSALSDLKSDCHGDYSTSCDPTNVAKVDSDLNRGRTASTMLTVLGAVGIVGAATGVTLLTISRSHGPETSLVVSPSSVTAVGSF